jgi:hypothetical protein
VRQQKKGKKAMWHEAAKQNAKSICHIDVVVYGDVWETMLKNEGDELEATRQVSEKAEGENAEG